MEFFVVVIWIVIMVGAAKLQNGKVWSEYCKDDKNVILFSLNAILTKSIPLPLPPPPASPEICAIKSRKSDSCISK